jgi:DNA-binding LacI/PurR family transcriptional regulator
MHKQINLLFAVSKGISVKVINPDKFKIEDYKDKYDAVIGMEAGRYLFDNTLVNKFMLLPGTPYIELMSDEGGDLVNHITADDKQGMKILIEHLATSDNKTIGYFSKSTRPFEIKRYNAFKEYIKSSGLIFKEKWHYINNPDPESNWANAIHSFEKILSDIDLPDIIMFSNDYQAALFCKLARENNVSIPGKVSITGFDKSPSADIALGQGFLTTVKLDFVRAGELAVTLASEIALKKRKPSGNRILLPCSLIEGRSVKNIRNSNITDEDFVFKQSVIKYLHAHLGQQKVATRISSLLGYNHRYFLKKFAKIFGVTFVDYYTSKKMERAAFLLKSTKKTAIEIAFSLGYNSYQNFLHAFSKHLSVNPIEFRKKL